MRFALLCLIAAIAAPSQAAVPKPTPAPRAETGCEILDAGLYVPASERVKFEDATSVTGERYEIDEVTFTKQTRIVPLELHRGFGIRYRLRGLSKVKESHISWRIFYPRSIKGKPGWERSDKWAADGNGEVVQHLLYDFAHDYELVAGNWRFHILVDGKPACSVTFTVK